MKRIHLINLTLWLAILSLSSCNKPPKTREIEVFGKLREIMMEQKLHSRVSLTDFEGKPNLYALGALENLAGEITIIGGKSWLSKVKDSTLVIQNGYEEKAALLVATQVEEWSGTSLKSIESTAMLSDELEKLAPESEPFPFMLKGKFTSLEWHIINGPGATARNHDAYKAAGISRTDEALEGTVIGFFSKNHQGTFTHHGSFLHMHFVSENEKLTGHVDGLSFEDVELFIPKTMKQ